MFKSYFKTAWRNLIKNKTFALINIAGLSIGIAACLLILQYVSFELSYDQFNKNVDAIYRVVNDRYQNGKLIQHGIITYSAIGNAIQYDFPEVVNHVRVELFRSQIISNNTKKIGDQNVLAVDNSFLAIYSYDFIAGDKTTVKEIGVRKVLGAGVPNIVTLLSKDFLALVLVAAAIAFPVAWYGLNSFLQGYAYPY